MNWLIIDFGNSRIKWAEWNGKRIKPAGTIEYRNRPLSQLWKQCWINRPPPQRVIVTSVAQQQANESLSAWCNKTWGIPAEFLHSSAQACGVSSGYREPLRLGVDRWAAIIAAHHLFPGQTVCIADCGTATTIDALDSNGQHLGGLILPGQRLMQHSLYSGTARIGLPDSNPESENLSFGEDTSSAVTLGCRYALVGAMEQMAAKLGKTAESEVVCIITGGDAVQLLPYLDGRWQHRSELVLEGARILADNNTTRNT